MLIKSADDRSEDIATLKTLLTEPNLIRFERECIEEELYSVQKGAWGEQDAAYFLNFYFRRSEHHLLLHDLRIVLSDDRTAQIDHLLVNSFQDFYVLESKNWNQLTVEKTGACTTGGLQTFGTPSPLEQCKRHASVLTRAFQIDLPIKKIAPRFHIIPRVLMAPKCLLKAPHHEEWYVKADLFYSQRAKEVESVSFVKNVLDLPRFTGKQKLEKLGQALLDLHNPKPIDWRAKFGLSPMPSDINRTANQVVTDIEGLSDYVPRWGEDWFELTGKPNEEIKAKIKAAGYRAKKENGSWIWRLKP